MPGYDDNDAEDAAAFKDEAVATAYQKRPPYPRELIDLMAELAVDTPRVVLDLGCGSGDLARPLAPLVEEVHAVDFSLAMLAAGKQLPGGAARNLRWYCAAAENFAYPAVYSLAVAGESLHWMDQAVVLARLKASLSPRGRLVVVVRLEDAPWQDRYNEIARTYSVKRRNYVARDLPTELERCGLFRVEERRVMPPVPFTQSVEDYVELQHSRSSFARHRMSREAAAQFDETLREAIARFATGGSVTYDFSVDVAWGRPV